MPQIRDANSKAKTKPEEGVAATTLERCVEAIAAAPSPARIMEKLLHGAAELSVGGVPVGFVFGPTGMPDSVHEERLPKSLQGRINYPNVSLHKEQAITVAEL